MDAYQEWGKDVQLSPTGDIALVSGGNLSQQRILRRLFTTQSSYIWHVNYGGSLKKYIGMPVTSTLLREIEGNIRAQIFKEISISQNPAPTITFQEISNGLDVTIVYYLKNQQQPEILNFRVSS